LKRLADLHQAREGRGCLFHDFVGAGEQRQRHKETISYTARALHDLIKSKMTVDEFCARALVPRKSLPPVEKGVEQQHYQWPTETPKQSQIEDAKCSKADGTTETCKRWPTEVPQEARIEYLKSWGVKK
jgi:hypothetical protein